MPGLHQPDPSPGVPEWIVTYGDMMSLVLTFFIMLVSMGEIKEETKYQAMVESLRERFGYDASIMSLMPGPAKPGNSAFSKLATMGRARRADTLNGGDKVKAPVGENPRVQSLRKGENPTIGGVLYFDDGSSELTAEQKRILQSVAQEVGGKPQKIEIRGHTSSRPLPKGCVYKTHWELAFARSSHAMDFLVKLGINPKRMRIAVAADNEPKHLGKDPLLQKENDRVEVYMIDELVDELQGTAEEQKQRFSGAVTP